MEANEAVAHRGHNASRLEEMKVALREHVGKDRKIPFNDEYILSVMDKLKNGSPRTFEYSLEKLKVALDMRVQDFNLDEPLPEHIRAQAFEQWFYLYGYDLKNRPVIFVRACNRNTKATNKAPMDYAHYVADVIQEALKLCPPGVTQFAVVDHEANVKTSMYQYVNIKFMRSLGDTFLKSNPDRMGQYLLGPIGFMLNMISKALEPLFPANTRKKFTFLKEKEILSATEEMLGKENVPDYLGGPVHHEVMSYEDMFTKQKELYRKKFGPLPGDESC